MRIGTQDVTVGSVYRCEECGWTVTVHGLPAMLIVADHFGAHMTGNGAALNRTLKVTA